MSDLKKRYGFTLDDVDGMFENTETEDSGPISVISIDFKEKTNRKTERYHADQHPIIKAAYQEYREKHHGR